MQNKRSWKDSNQDNILKIDKLSYQNMWNIILLFMYDTLAINTCLSCHVCSVCRLQAILI